VAALFTDVTLAWAAITVDSSIFTHLARVVKKRLHVITFLSLSVNVVHDCMHVSAKVYAYRKLIPPICPIYLFIYYKRHSHRTQRP